MSMASPPRVLAHLRDAITSVIIAECDGSPFIGYVGDVITSDTINPALLHRGVVGGGLDTEVFPWIITEPHRGWMGEPGIQIRRDNELLPVHCTLVDVSQKQNTVHLTSTDEEHAVTTIITISLDESGVVRMNAKCTNTGTQDMCIDSLKMLIPVSGECTEVLTLGGRHAMEAIETRHLWQRSVIAVNNRSGRTSHEHMGVVFVGTQNFSEQSGSVWGVHCAWSGNSSILCDSVTDGLRVVQVGELLQPGEVVLAPQETYDTPDVVLSYSPHGMNGVSHSFHRYVRSIAGPQNRPIVLNTWEAVYFSHDLATLKQLASEGADVGIERFVLDDGWFHGRRDDTAGLGDWWVDEHVWPHGLGPLVEHVNSLGMEFGLWFEPEMVNPNSELFRAHPDWVLGSTHRQNLMGRHQYVLNMALPEVREYLFQHINTLLSRYNIAYVKWDHNRPLVGGAAHHQTKGVYELFHQLTRAHPSVQFESCASGGGRIDMGISQYVKRFWTSDSIDALDRLTIQKGVSKLVPIEMMGSHIGAKTCHTTGRKHALSFRTATAMFGWLGVEWNLLSLQPHEKEQLQRSLSLYKEFRPLLHSGDYIRCDHPDNSIHVHAVVSSEASEALMSISRLFNIGSIRSANICVPALDAQSEYTVTMIPNGTPRWALHRELPEWVKSSVQVSGAQLMKQGLPCPPLLPESSVLLHIVRVSS